MAIVVLFEFPGESVEKYDQALESGGDGIQNQSARSHHVCYETNDGWGVVDVWDGRGVREVWRGPRSRHAIRSQRGAQDLPASQHHVGLAPAS